MKMCHYHILDSGEADMGAFPSRLEATEIVRMIVTESRHSVNRKERMSDYSILRVKEECEFIDCEGA